VNVTAAALNGGDWADFLARLSMDLLAILLVALVFYLRRHQRRDLFLIFVSFNLGVFGVLAVITEHKISAAVGFGLFALLSIIRLRSQPFANVELAYFFASLVLGVVNGIGHGDKRLNAVIDLVLVAAIFVLDHPRLQVPIQRRRVMLDQVWTDSDALRTELEGRFGVEITELRISEVDYVRETTSVSIRFVGGSRRPASDLFTLEEEGPVA
jgi:hypothetical protein